MNFLPRHKYVPTALVWIFRIDNPFIIIVSSMSSPLKFCLQVNFLWLIFFFLLDNGN